MQDTVPRGAAPINDDFEVGYNPAFETRWNLAQTTGRCIMAAYLAASLAGLLGRGPYSHSTIQSLDGLLSVDFEPLARNGTPTLITLHVMNMRDKPMPADIFISGGIVQPLYLETMDPQPKSAEAGRTGMKLHFMVGANQENALIRFRVRPQIPGTVVMEAREGGSTVHWTQRILP